MLSLPDWLMPLLGEFAPVVGRKTTWHKVEFMVVGAIVATGKRTVSAVLRVMGLSQECHYARYRHVLSRAVWSFGRQCHFAASFAEDLGPTQRAVGVWDR
jgi:hypothetical protein